MSESTSGVASWGVSGSVSGVSGIVTGIQDDEEPILAPEYNEKGQVVKQTLYDGKGTVTATIEVAAGTDKPAKGAQITINGKTGYVVKSSLVEDNQAYRKISVTLEYYDHCSQTTAV